MAFDSQCLSVNRTHTAPGKEKVTVINDTMISESEKQNELQAKTSEKLHYCCQ